MFDFNNPTVVLGAGVAGGVLVLVLVAVLLIKRAGRAATVELDRRRERDLDHRGR